MKRLSLSVVLSGDALHPMHAALDEGLGERSELVDVSVATDTQTFLYRVTGDRAAYESRLETVDSVDDYAVTPVDDRRFYLLTRESLAGEQASTLDAVTGGDLLLSTPVTFLPDGRVELSLVGPGEQLETALEELPLGVSVTVDAVHDDPTVPAEPGDRLTDRQREALTAATAVGYFDVPRDGTVEDVADELDCSTGTASEHLRKAQATLAAAVVE